MLAQIKRNHQREIIGTSINSPLIRTNLRVFVNSYVMFARQNKPEDTRPCAIIMVSPAYKPSFVLLRIPATISPMWPTDEYAISDFISVCRKQIKLEIKAPNKASKVTSLQEIATWLGNKVVARISPYPPNFRRMAAKIIEPATGASTWALGSHKWTEQIGSFTINAAVIIIHASTGFIDSGNKIQGQAIVECPDLSWINHNRSRRGNEATTV